MPRLFAVQLKDGPAERYEQWVNTPVYTRDYEDCVGWLGCELPEDGHSCEFAELAGDGAVTCASSVKVNRLRDENAKLRELLSLMYRNMQGVLDCSTDTVFANSIMTLRDHMDECMEVMAELGMPPRDYESRRRELGLESKDDD